MARLATTNVPVSVRLTNEKGASTQRLLNDNSFFFLHPAKTAVFLTLLSMLRLTFSTVGSGLIFYGRYMCNLTGALIWKKYKHMDDLFFFFKILNPTLGTMVLPSLTIVLTDVRHVSYLCFLSLCPVRDTSQQPP